MFLGGFFGCCNGNLELGCWMFVLMMSVLFILVIIVLFWGLFKESEIWFLEFCIFGVVFVFLNCLGWFNCRLFIKFDEMFMGLSWFFLGVFIIWVIFGVFCFGCLCWCVLFLLILGDLGLIVVVLMFCEGIDGFGW